MSDYRVVANEIARVRKAWLRARAWHGLTVWAVDLLGVFGLALLANALFDLRPLTRLLLLAAVVALTALHGWRHMVRPLRRRITDEQMALFIEEQNDRYEGAFIAAAEFGARADWSAEQRALVQRIVDAAVERARRFDPAAAVRAVRWGKYGAGLAVLLAIYVVAGMFQPVTLRESALKTLNPFYVKKLPGNVLATPVQAVRAVAAPTDLAPLQMALTRGGQPLAEVTQLKRGARFGLEATFNRDPAESERPVRFNFRPQAPADAERQSLPLAQVDKVYGFGLELPDVNEDLEFTVSAGGLETRPYRIQVYDPLKVEQVTVVTRAPACMRWPESKSVQPRADVNALVGSEVELEIRANNPLKSGTLRWQAPAAPQAGQVDAAAPRNLKAAFKVTTNTWFALVLKDAFGQEAEILPPCVVTARPDDPPTQELVSPKMDASATPLGDVRVVAEVKDDVALERVDIVCVNPLNPAAGPRRFVCELKPNPNAAASANDPQFGFTDAIATGVLEVEKMNDGKSKMGDTLVYHVEVFDRKGQSVVSDPYFLWLNTYETAGFWNFSIPKKKKPHVGVKKQK
ncbi:MAG TPA: hypothetical protein VMW52_08565, partial [Phycisphaerae bacterium]|nr:hypothetical protein [Phycisphaerae bacterium]